MTRTPFSRFLSMPESVVGVLRPSPAASAYTEVPQRLDGIAWAAVHGQNTDSEPGEGSR